MARQLELAAGARHRRGDRETQRHELDRRHRAACGRTAPCRPPRTRRARPLRSSGDGMVDGDLAALADIAHVGETLDRAALDVGAGQAQHVERFLFEIGEDRLDGLHVGAGQRRREARHAIDARRRHQHADGAARARARRADDALHAELARDVPGMDRPGAAGRQQRILRRDAAALGDRHARGAGHVLVHHVVHAEGGAAGSTSSADASVPNALSVAAGRSSSRRPGRSRR